MTIKDQIVEFLVKYGFQIVGSVIILICGLFVAGAVGRLVKKALARFRLDQPIELLLVRISKLLILAFTGILTVSKMGVDIAPLVAGVGVIGVGIGLATQGVLANLVAGLLIIFSKPYRVGEYIELVGERGVVQVIDLFSTKLLHFDKSVVVIPNRKIAGEILHNYGLIRQLDLSVGVAYNSVLNAVQKTVRTVLDAHPHVLREPAALIGITRLADSNIELAVRPWVKVENFPTAGGEIYQAIIEAFRTCDVNIALPQREIRVLDFNAVANNSIRVMEAAPKTGI